jgi:DNA adenine methylase
MARSRDTLLLTASQSSSRDPKLLQLLPPLKWAGGKRWLVPNLQALWQPHRRLVEPFCGGLAVALGLQPQTALLNDANPLLINFYRHLQQGLVMTESFQNEAAFYYEARTRLNCLIAAGEADTVEAAGLFYYLNRTGYNGLCRFNRQGLFNVPFGRYVNPTYVSDFRAYQSTLAHWTFQRGDFSALSITPNDWVYADPPYDVPFTSYSAGGFNWADQERLAHWLMGLPCPVVASNQATERIIDLYKGLGFEVQTLPAPRRIACTGNRTDALEMLAIKTR